MHRCESGPRVFCRGRGTKRSGFLVLLFLAAAVNAWPATLYRSLDNKGTSIAFRDGKMLFLQCNAPAGPAGKALLQQYLSDPVACERFAGRGTIAIRFDYLKPEVQRNALLSLFERDCVTADGWVHYAGDGAPEDLAALCEWLTGSGANAVTVLKANNLSSTQLQKGQRVVFPLSLLRGVMQSPTPWRGPQQENAAPAADLAQAAEELQFVSIDGKDYAAYHLKRGEALYTAVVVRFTAIETNDEIIAACRLIQKLSGIPDVHSMEPGTRVLIPVELLSDRFKPRTSPDRQRYEEVIQEAARLRGQVVSKDLAGVVVILDPGHGGRDYGASNGKHSLYEDELNYDIVCRIKKLLEEQTQAKVYVTCRDRSSSFASTSATRFTHDTDEELLTTPPYNNGDAKLSVNLRWHLANAIYKRELAAGTDPRKMIFTSMHCDYLFNFNLRGAMIYIPGAAFRRDSEHPGPDSFYNKYKEARENGLKASSTLDERKRDEALSRNFASTLLNALGEKRIKRHDAGEPVRNKIIRNGQSYVPAVLRNTAVPTKVLVECANMANDTDCERLADPEWRQWFAEAYVDALRTYFGS